VKEMNPGWSRPHERAATLALDKQPASAPFDASRKATERKLPNKSAATLLLRFLYWIYERRLIDQLKQKPMPRHIGIILDGNRRHARKRGLSDPCEIYQRGAEKLDDILDWCAELQMPQAILRGDFWNSFCNRIQGRDACSRSLSASTTHPNTGHWSHRPLT